MKKSIIFALMFLFSFVLGWTARAFLYPSDKIPAAFIQKVARPLEKYTIENLTKRNPSPGAISVDLQGATLQGKFSFTTDNKKVTGQINIPEGAGPFPLIIMLRGYVDKEIYQTGLGTRKAAAEFAKAGFITLAPDFLGYGGSDRDADSIFEARFQTYTTILDLLASLPSFTNWDKLNIFIWAHSNGGQIALATLEISQREIPTVLWAPVSKPFPYSILAYSDEASDSGKFLRRKISQFDEIYDSDLYSIHKYFDRIKAPVQIEQGTADQEVPFWWTQELVKTLKSVKLDIKVNYYPGADHNLTPGWSSAISRDITFFKSHMTP